ncbi:MAG: ADP-ribosylglycohydrolase family protein [Sphingobacteriales bacterium]|nr:ADP-ribosylglycohydrolase family protein [Sphingobacteriales bacterium]
MSEIAKATNWKIRKMPDEIETFTLERVFSSEEFERIRMGLVPRQMEDKWFIYYDDDVLNFHRSWSGVHVYKVALRNTGNNNYETTEVVVNRNRKQYNQGNPEYDVLLVNYLIDRLLLGKNIPFPTPHKLEGEERQIYKHAIVGYAEPNTPEPGPEINFGLPRGERLQACLAGGAIGDAIGSFYEGRKDIESVAFDILQDITDDTQLTIATCESILESGRVSPEGIAKKMLEWYNKGKLSGLGASTLKALRDLQAGAHWALSGRSGEYAAGNGAAMRIAPLAFFVNVDTERTLIRDVCYITHKNDEAYVGCLAILYALHFTITDQWGAGETLLNLIIPRIPDTAVRDNLIKLQENPSLSIREAAYLVGTSGYAPQSVPFAIFAAQKIKDMSFEDIITDIILCGGDTDTNASLAGQIMGTYTGLSGFSSGAIAAFNKIKESGYILQAGSELSNML